MIQVDVTGNHVLLLINLQASLYHIVQVSNSLLALVEGNVDLGGPSRGLVIGEIGKVGVGTDAFHSISKGTHDWWAIGWCWRGQTFESSAE